MINSKRIVTWNAIISFKIIGYLFTLVINQGRLLLVGICSFVKNNVSKKEFGKPITVSQ